MPQHSGERAQSRGDARRDQKKQARSASPDRDSSSRDDRQELAERPSESAEDSAVPDKRKREPRSASEARTADQAKGDTNAGQSRHAEAERRLGQRPEQENEERDEE